MASGPFDVSREKHKWVDSDKVYSRKGHGRGSKGANGGGSGVKTKNANGVKNSNVNAAQQTSQTRGVTEDAHSSNPRVLSRFGAVLDDSSNFGRPGIGNGFKPFNGNGMMGIVKVDNRIRINNLSSRSLGDIREIRRKLVGELDQVRSLVKKLESKEGELSGYSGGGGYSHSQVSVMEKEGGSLRVNSEVGSVGPHVSRPFQELSVSVLENSHGAGDSVDKEKRMPKANQLYRNSDFLLAKDKFPPPDSNKKSKSKKHGGGREHGFGMERSMNRVFRSCGNLLSKLMKHKHGWVFNTPVDVKKLGLHDYYTIIKHPMDFGTVKSKLSKNLYMSPREFAEDMRITFRNAMTYNPKGQDVHYMAEVLSNLFEEKWAALEAEHNLNWNHGVGHESDLPTPTSRMAPSSLQKQQPSMSETLDRFDSAPVPVDPKSKPPLGRIPVPKKPKARDPNKRDMTYEEKQKLSRNLQNLPSEKLDSIVQIIKKRNSALSQHDDEIEVDIDSVDAETLWELERFVTNYKKSLNKNKRKAEMVPEAREEPGPSDQETAPNLTTAEAPKENKTDDNVVSTSNQEEQKGDNASHTSSSSSSSSDSASSSSDSDSDSSAVNGS